MSKTPKGSAVRTNRKGIHCHIEFEGVPFQNSLCTESEIEGIDKQTHEFTAIGIVEETQFDKDHFILPIFTRPKKD